VIGAGEDGTLNLYDHRSKGTKKLCATPYPITALALSPNRTEIFFGDENGNIRIYD
jgi:WD40 repeat protein